MKRTSIIAGLIACGALLGSPAAFAASGSYNSTTYGKDTHMAHQAPWERGNPSYNATAPGKMGCAEFTKSDDAHQNYVVAWLDGYFGDSSPKANTDEHFTPRSVSGVNAACKANPNESVMAAAKNLP